MSHRELHRGMRGNDVIFAKIRVVHFLVAHGRKREARSINLTDPRFGRGLYAGVRIYQYGHHLHVDGVIGPKRWAQLDPRKLTRVDTLMNVARSQLGVHEIGGSNRGPQVERYIHAGHGVPGESWCGDFTDWCVLEAHIPLLHTFRYVPGAEAWAKHQGRWHLNPAIGRACIMDFDGGVSDHVGLVESIHDGYIINIEGNTSSGTAGSQDNGGGVYRRVRPHSLVRGYIDLL